MARELPESPFELPEPTRSSAVQQLAEQTSRVRVVRSVYIHAPMTECWRVVVDGALVIAEMQNGEWASAVAVVLDSLMSDGASLDSAMEAMVDLSGARELIAGILESAARRSSAEISPAAALAEAAERIRSRSR